MTRPGASPGPRAENRARHGKFPSPPVKFLSLDGEGVSVAREQAFVPSAAEVVTILEALGDRETRLGRSRPRSSLNRRAVSEHDAGADQGDELRHVDPLPAPLVPLASSPLDPSDTLDATSGFFPSLLP